RFHERLAKEGHALAALPLALDSVERQAPSYMPLYGDKGLGSAIESLASGAISARTVPPPADGGAASVRPIDDAAVLERMKVAVRPWAVGSKGRVEAKLFAVDPPVDETALGSWLLRALPLEAAKGAPRLDVLRATADGVFGALFSAASNGGAYS